MTGYGPWRGCRPNSTHTDALRTLQLQLTDLCLWCVGRGLPRLWEELSQNPAVAVDLTNMA